LKKGDQIKGWSRLHGETSLVFKIDEVGDTWISVLPQTKIPRRISKGDFSQVYAFWKSYCAGEVGRAEMTTLSQNTSYIFALLHWREGIR
jgi:hypothetical protein